MYDSLVQFFTNTNPSLKCLSPAAREYLKCADMRGAAARHKDYPVFIELLNSNAHRYENFSDVNARPSHGDSLLLECYHGQGDRPCMFAEVLKRGANPNTKEERVRGNSHVYPCNYGDIYPTTYVIQYGRDCWAIRLLVLYGGNFDLLGTGGEDKYLDKTARQIAKETLTGMEFSKPTEKSPLRSQQVSFFRGNSPATPSYLELVEEEVREMQAMKTQGDRHFKEGKYLDAATEYDRAGQQVEQFAGDHEQLLMFYLSMALGYYHNALLAYEQSANTEKTVHYSEHMLAHIDKLTKPCSRPPSPSLLPAERRDAEILEEIKSIRDSAVMRAILKEQAFFLAKRAQYRLLQAPTFPASPAMQRVHASIQATKPTEEDSDTTSLTSSGDDPNTPLLKKKL